MLCSALLCCVQGIDMFDCAHLVALANAGYALCFPVSPEAEATQQQAAAGAAGAAADAATQAASAAGGSAAAEAAEAAAEAAADCGQDDTKINLWALAYRTDKRPLLPGCPCFACARHTRAYLHHLLQAHEMTAQVGGKLSGWLCASAATSTSLGAPLLVCP